MFLSIYNKGVGINLNCVCKHLSYISIETNVFSNKFECKLEVLL